MNCLFQKIFFVLRIRYWNKVNGVIKKCWFRMLGMKIGSGTSLGKLYVTWPHQVAIGRNCLLEENIYLKYDGIWQPDCCINISNNVFVGSNVEFNIKHSIAIGPDSLIASGCKFIDHDHSLIGPDLMRLQCGVQAPINIGSNVWLGCNVVILKGVHIGDGSIVAAGAVVTKSIPPDEIWGGVPARMMKKRMSV